MLAENNSMYNDFYLKKPYQLHVVEKQFLRWGLMWGPLILSFNAIAHRGTSLKPPVTNKNHEPLE